MALSVILHAPRGQGGVNDEGKLSNQGLQLNTSKVISQITIEYLLSVAMLATLDLFSSPYDDMSKRISLMRPL